MFVWDVISYMMLWMIFFVYGISLVGNIKEIRDF